MPEATFKGSRYAKARSEVGVAHHRKDPEAIEVARRNFATEKIVHYIERVLADAPPLSTEQRGRISSILNAGAGDDAT